MSRLIIASCLAMAVSSVSASEDQIMTGSGLLAVCGQLDESWISFCNGYVQAAFDTFHRPDVYICPPQGVTRANMAGAVFEALAVAPELSNVRGTEAAARILAATYPC